MGIASKFFVNYNLKRCFSSNSMNCAKYGSRQGRFMNKLMGADGGKKKWYPVKERKPTNPMMMEKITSNHVTRRMTVLNKLFMQHITDLMATGEASTELVGRKIEITHVKVTPDFQKVLVYWGSRKMGDEIEIANTLNDCAYRIRHELTQLRVIGQVPMIQFVKNKQLAGIAEIEKRLNFADYGEDFQPTGIAAAPKSELTLTINLPPEIREQILKLKDPLEEDEEDDDSKYDVELPPMRHDVLGLDHAAIMNRVTESLKKSQVGAKNRLLNITTILPNENATSWDVLGGVQPSKEESQAFVDFLIKRQMQEKRKFRRENKEHVLIYNLRSKDVDDDVAEADDYFVNDEKDADDFEDFKLETLK